MKGYNHVTLVGNIISMDNGELTLRVYKAYKKTGEPDYNDINVRINDLAHDLLIDDRILVEGKITVDNKGLYINCEAITKLKRR